MSTEPSYLSQLMIAAQQGDQAAYRQLLGEITPVIKAFLRRRVFNHDLIDDILQDILIGIHKARHTYRPDQPFENWMYGIARHKLIDSIRKQTRIGGFETGADYIDDLPVTKTDPLPKGKKEDISHDIKLALGALPEKQKKIVKYMKIQGHSVAETAKKFDMSESAVKTSTHRSLKKMQEWLARNGYA